MIDPGWGILIAKRVYSLFLASALLKSYIRLPKGATDLILFIEKNFERAMLSEEGWENTGPVPGNVEGLTDKTIFVIWTCMEFSEEVNHYRKAHGYTQINFLGEAMLYDKKQKASQQPRKDPDQKGQGS